eukprot:JP441152.1.p1 GENE.JP441152.1~~JP441152.1.p1  ORF type:complete len:76 (+),score=7.01 JP441152.1:57-284(+)
MQARARTHTTSSKPDCTRSTFTAPPFHAPHSQHCSCVDYLVQVELVQIDFVQVIKRGLWTRTGRVFLILQLFQVG